MLFFINVCYFAQRTCTKIKKKSFYSVVCSAGERVRSFIRSQKPNRPTDRGYVGICVLSPDQLPYIFPRSESTRSQVHKRARRAHRMAQHLLHFVCLRCWCCCWFLLLLFPFLMCLYACARSHRIFFLFFFFIFIYFYFAFISVNFFFYLRERFFSVNRRANKRGIWVSECV